MLSDKSTTFPVKMAAKVVRLSSEGMGVRFMDNLHHLYSSPHI